MGTQLAPPQKGGTAPTQFLAHFYCGQTAAWIKMPLGMEVGFGTGHIALDGDPAPPKGGTATVPQFSAHVCGGQMAGWIKMPLGMKVGPGRSVLHRDPAPPPKSGTAPSIFGRCLLWPNRGPSQLLLSTCSNGGFLKI